MKIIRKSERLRSIQERQYFLLICLGLVMAVAIDWLAQQASSELTIEIALIVSLLIIALTSPFWGLILAVYLDLWFSYVSLLWVPPHNYVIPFILLLIFLNMFVRGKLQINRHALKILLISLGFIGWAIAVNFTNGLPLNFTAYETGRLAMQVLIFMCVVFLLSNRPHFMVFLYSMIAGAAISSLVAIMQFANVDFFWQLRALIGLDPHTIVGQQILTRARVPGLAYFSISLAYQLSAVIPLLFGILMTQAVGSNKRPILWGTLLVLLGGLFVTLTRSAILGVLIGCTVILSGVYKGKMLRVLKISTLLLFISVILFTIEPVRNRFVYLDESAYARIPMTLAAIKISLSHPLGVGTGQFSAQAEQFFSELAGFRGAHQILHTGAHNQFLNTLVYYGFPGFLLLLILYKRVFQSLVYLWRTNQSSWIRGAALGLLGSFVSYLVNSLFHNAGPFIGDPFHWYFIGLVAALYSIGRKRKDADYLNVARKWSNLLKIQCN